MSKFLAYTLNKKAVETVLTNAKADETAETKTFRNIRARVVDGVIQFKPTNRKSAVNLPKGEELAELSYARGAVPGAKLKLPVTGDVDTAVPEGLGLVFSASKHGWFILTPSAELTGVPSAKVALLEIADPVPAPAVETATVAA